MKLLALGLVGMLTACTNSPPVDNPSAPSQFRAAGEQNHEARALEDAESECAKQGKHAEASRVEGDTVYTCK